MIRLSLLVVALYGICCAMAFGQTAPPPSAPPPPSSKEHTGPGIPQQERPNDYPERNGRPLMRNTGGSLLLESLSHPPDPNQLKYGDVSLLAVPEAKPREIKKHDLVTIIVAEESQSQTTGTTDLKKNADLDMKVDAYVKLNLAQMAAHAVTPATVPELKAEGQRDFKGDATVNRQDSFTARIGAEVIDVKPNGTLVIQARKHIKTDEEEQDFVLTGVCRAVDLTPDNTILSNTLHDLDVHKVTKGAARDTTKRGFIPRLLDFVNPF
jgi:flagellar L-ring protein FlgH